MADEEIKPVPEASPSSEGTPSVPAVEPVVPTPDAPVVEPTKTDPAPEITPEAPKEAAKDIKEPAKAEILLSQDKKVEEKPVEKKADEKPAEVKTEEKAVETPKYELKLPEGVTVDDAKMGDFTKMLGDFEVSSKVSHDEMQKLGQQMVERHIEELQRYTKSLTDAWNKQASDWKDSFLKAPEFANRTDTVLRAAKDAINIYGGDSKQQQEFFDLMESSKVGNHPAMIRLLSNIMVAKAEPRPLAAPQIASATPMSKYQKMYGAKKS